MLIELLLLRFIKRFVIFLSRDEIYVLYLLNLLKKLIILLGEFIKNLELELREASLNCNDVCGSVNKPGGAGKEVLVFLFKLFK